MGKLTEPFYHLPETIQKLLKFSIDRLQPIEIILFGSRARGDHREDSDFDFAFRLTPQAKKNWPKFILETEDTPFTLYDVDLIDIDQLDAQYLKDIATEGVRLYG